MQAEASSFAKPGHIFPLQARAGLLRERSGHTEAAIELCHLSGSTMQHGSAVACLSELYDRKTGKMVTATEGKNFADDHHLCFLTVRDMQQFLADTFCDGTSQ